MTSDVGVERVDQQFLFHCSCGAAIETNEKKEICWHCDASIEVITCVQTSAGKKYTLRIRKHQRAENTERSLWPPIYSAARFHRRHQLQGPDHDILRDTPNTTPSTRHRGEVRDIEKNCMHLGLLILSAPLWLPLMLAICLSIANISPAPVEQNRSNAQIIGPGPEPTDCGWFSGCHYEKRAIQVRDNRGLHILVSWQRVKD